MSKSRCRRAITLFEILAIMAIVVVLLGTVVPQFLPSTNDPKCRSLQFNLHTVRSQIGRYRLQHAGKFPTLANFADQMTKPTDVTGATTGANLLYGPYFQGQVPHNVFNDSNAVTAVAKPGQEPTAVVAGGAGWQYDESNGGFFPNHAEYYAER
jgi:type II secretory pathway pseudopilin PulG